MSKEQLEDIKKEVELLRGDMCVTSIEVDTSADAILDDMDWLIERVQELERQYKEKLGQWSKVCQSRDKYEIRSYRLEHQNKRYREALEFYAGKRHVNGYLMDGELARKALEGESNENEE